MITQCISLPVLSVARVKFPAVIEVFQGILSWLITLCQAVLSQHGREWLNIPSMVPHNLWTSGWKAKI